MRRPLATVAALALASIAAGGCNEYEMFRVAGFSQEDFSNKADLLFVADGSPSMYLYAGEMAANFDEFVNRLLNPSETDPSRPPLTRAVADYVLSVSNRGSVVDFQIAMTSPDIAVPEEPGDNGSLYRGRGGSGILSRTNPNLIEDFRYKLLCEATCYLGPNGGLPSKEDIGIPGWQCGDPLLTGDIFYEYNDCLCGSRDVWMGNCGSGQEEPLEATLLALCRTLDPNDPSANVQDLLDVCEERSPFERDVHGLTNAAMLREDSTLVVVYVSDEGDGSRRLAQGEPDPQLYLDLYNRFPTRMSWAVVGPNVDRCGGFGATRWEIERLRRLAEVTNGFYDDIEAEPDEDGNCDIVDFAESFRRLGDLLAGLLDSFPLQSVPDVETIRAFVDGRRVPAATEDFDETTGRVTYFDGWSYDPTENSVRFHGDAIPDFGARVRIYYRPLEGMPRTLPF